ncbi:MAG TPA: glycosyltransferase family 2 protein [bacterium]|nr:glycosyltransferase family 2 protein [bacterium]
MADSDSKRTWLSVVVPVYNERECIQNVYASISRTLEQIGRPAEIIFIDDGSGDGSSAILDALAEKDAAVRVIRFRRNFGQTAALRAGFDYARGEVIVSMDGDGQNDPRDIPRLLAKLEEGYDVVNGWRKDRKDFLVRRRIPSWLGNKLISVLTEVKLHDFGCTLKAYRREILEELSLYGEMHRMIPVLAHIMGASLAEVEVAHHPRAAGRSKYSLDRAFSVVLDLITLKFLLGYFTRPLHFFGLVGLISMLFGMASFAALVIMKVYDNIDMTGNPFLILGTLAVIVGTQLVMFGLLTEVSIRTYFESQNKPIYVIKEIRERSS